ncbi:MAG: tetratricopeptide repeat protein [Bacteroidota bacterium]
MKHYPYERLEALVRRYENQLQDQAKPLFKKSELLLLADYFEFERFLSKALEVVDYGIEQFDNSSELQVRKTRLLIYNAHLDQAMELLERKKTKGLNPSQRSLLHVEILIVQKKFSEAHALITALKRQYGKTRKILSDVFFLESLLYDKAGDFERSFFALETTLGINPNHQEAKGKLWMTMELSKKFKPGIILGEYLIQQDHYSCISWFNLAHAYYANFEYQKAREAFGFCIAINEDFESAYIDMAEVSLLLLMFREAADHLKVVVEKFKIKEQDILLDYGRALLKSGESRAARSVLEECKTLIDPFDPDVLFWLGETYQVERKWAAAIELYLSVLDFDSCWGEAHSSLGKCYFALAEFELAEKHFREAIDISPDNLDTYVELASYFLNIGELAQCEQTLIQASEGVDHHVRLNYYQAAILMLRGKENQALELMKDALQTDFSSHEEVYELAPELVGNKKIEDIINYYAGEQ